MDGGESTARARHAAGLHSRRAAVVLYCAPRFSVRGSLASLLSQTRSAPAIASPGLPVVVGVPRETHPGERRVALVPTALATLLQAGVEVRVEAGAGERAGYRDAAYADKGARVLPRAEVLAADVVLQVRSVAAAADGAADDLGILRAGQTLVGLMEPLAGRPTLRDVAARGATLLALELLPRTTRAQTMDALSSQATISGYKAVILAAEAAWKIFPKLTTAAGTLAPVRAFVIGAGVAGLQAIATARRLGAVVEAYDVRPAVREQVESVGARFVELPLEGAEGGGGYALEMDEAFYRRQRETMARVVAASDVVITTAAVPGRRAPLLVTADMVDTMAPGSVVVDLAAAQGGNCEVTRADEVVARGGVTVLGPTNLAASAPFHASQLYARNVAAFLLHHLRDGALRLDLEDEITRETLVAKDGEIVHPRVRETLGLEPLAAAEPGRDASPSRAAAPTGSVASRAAGAQG